MVRLSLPSLPDIALLWLRLSSNAKLPDQGRYRKASSCTPSSSSAFIGDLRVSFVLMYFLYFMACGHWRRGASLSQKAETVTFIRLANHDIHSTTRSTSFEIKSPCISAAPSIGRTVASQIIMIHLLGIILICSNYNTRSKINNGWHG